MGMNTIFFCLVPNNKNVISSIFKKIIGKVYKLLKSTLPFKFYAVSSSSRSHT